MSQIISQMGLLLARRVDVERLATWLQVNPNPAWDNKMLVRKVYHSIVKCTNDKYHPKTVTKEEVAKELGDPSTWAQEEAELMEKFHQIQTTTKEILEHERQQRGR